MRSTSRAVQNIELMPQRQNLGVQLPSRLEAVAQQADEQEPQRNHCAMILIPPQTASQFGQSFRKRHALDEDVPSQHLRQRSRQRPCHRVKSIGAQRHVAAPNRDWVQGAVTRRHEIATKV
jgi:hypothetical protein